MTDPKHVLRNAESALTTIRLMAPTVTPNDYTTPVQLALDLLGKSLKRVKNMRAQLNHFRKKESARERALWELRALPEAERMAWLIDGRGKLGQRTRELDLALRLTLHSGQNWPEQLDLVRQLRTDSANWDVIRAWCAVAPGREAKIQQGEFTCITLCIAQSYSEQEYEPVYSYTGDPRVAARKVAIWIINNGVASVVSP